MGVAQPVGFRQLVHAPLSPPLLKKDVPRRRNCRIDKIGRRKAHLFNA